MDATASRLGAAGHIRKIRRAGGFTRASLILAVVLLVGLVATGVTSWVGSSRQAVTTSAAQPEAIVVTPTVYFPSQFVNQGTTTDPQVETH